MPRSWTPPRDDGPHFTYEIWANGSLRATTGRDITSTILRSLAPATSYSITVQGRDEGYHWSPFSDPVSITTQTANPNDDTAPTTPALVSAYGFGDGSTEMQIQWAQSTDDFDVQFNIRYDVCVNGVLEEVRFGSAARSSLTVNSEKTRSKSSPRILPATDRHRPPPRYPSNNRAFGAGQAGRSRQVAQRILREAFCRTQRTTSAGKNERVSRIEH